MKNLIITLVALVAFTACSVAQSITPRFGITKREDNTYQSLSLGSLLITPTGTMVTIPAQTKFTQLVSVASTSISSTFTANISSSYLGDQMHLSFPANASATTRTITLGANLLGSSPTMSIAQNKRAYMNFRFDGTTWYEISRTVEP